MELQKSLIENRLGPYLDSNRNGSAHVRQNDNGVPQDCSGIHSSKVFTLELHGNEPILTMQQALHYYSLMRPVVSDCNSDLVT